LVDRPKNEWKRVENTHEAIIGKQDFELARRISRLDTRSSPGGDSVYLFSGILICGSCGARMTRKAVPYKGEKYHYYYCPTTKKRGCEKATMLKEDVLHEYVLECVKAQIINVASIDSIIAGSDKQRASNALSKQYLMQITENENQLAKLTGFRATLYENMVTGLITKNDYTSFKAQYNADETRLHDAIRLLQQKNEDVLAGKGEQLRWMEQFKNFEGLAELDRRTVVNLIKSIRVVSKKELHITFNYQADFDKAYAIISKEAA